MNEPAEYIQDVVDDVGGNLSACQYSWLWERWHGCQWDHSGEAHRLIDHLATVNPAWVQIAPNDIIDGFGRDFDVANGSFEHRAPFGGFGWRYRLDGVERIHDPAGAPDGDYYIRLQQGEEVHQPIDATGDVLPGGTSNDQVYYASAMIRSSVSGSVAQINADFEGQQIYNRADLVTHSFVVDTTWQRYTTAFIAPNGSWKTFLILKSSSGTVEFDDVRMSNQPRVNGALSDPSMFRLSWQSSVDVVYEVQSSEGFAFWPVLNTVTGDGSVMSDDLSTTGTTHRSYRLHVPE